MGRVPTIARCCLAVAALLFLVSLATCYLGVQHDVDQIPPETRARMTDTDWVGVRWIASAMVMQSVASLLCLLSAGLLLFARVRSRRAHRDS